jgi:signal transduction histidine kinase
VTNAVKHATADQIVVRIDRDGDDLLVVVDDDGLGGADPSGSGLRGLADRVEALDGRLVVESPPGRGTRVRAVIPCG